MGGKRALVWFRKAMRLHDNPALCAALEGRPEAVFPVLVIAPRFFDPDRFGANRFRFFLDAAHELDKSLRDKGSVSAA